MRMASMSATGATYEPVKRGLPIVAISGHDYEERVLEIRTAGARDYVRKARVEEDLATALAALLGGE